MRSEKKNCEARHYVFFSLGLDVVIKYNARKNLSRPLSIIVRLDLKVSTDTLERKELSHFTVLNPDPPVRCLTGLLGSHLVE